MRCLECGAEAAEPAQVCARCRSWAPAEYQLYVAEDRAADTAYDAPGGPASAAIPADVGQQSPESAPDPKVDGAVLAQWVETRRFSDTRLRPGYDQEEVFAFLDAIRDSFLGVRKPSLTPDEIRVKQFSTTRLRPGYDQEEVDAFLAEANSRLAAQVSARREAPAAGPESGVADPTAEPVQIRCLECGAESAGEVRVCARCGAPIAYQRFVAADRAAGAVSDPASLAGPADSAAVVANIEGAGRAAAATAYAAGQTPPGPYVPGRGAEIPARIRRVRRGYSWMAWGAVFGGWALVAVGVYFYDLNSNSSSSASCVFAGFALWVLAPILVTLRILLSRFLRRPGDASGATVAACGRGGRMLVLNAPCDGYPSRLKVRLAWWDEPELLPPGQSVTLYGQPGGQGRVLVSSSAQGSAFVGLGRRPVPSAGGPAVQDALPQPGGQRAGRRYLVWAPLGIAAVSFVAAVAATVIASGPSPTDGLTEDQLMAGDCLTGSNLGLGTSSPWPDTVTAVPCTQQHIAEVFFAGNAWPQSLAFPGADAVNSTASDRCGTAFTAYDGLTPDESVFTYDTVSPNTASDWAPGDGDRLLVCVAWESTSRYPSGTLVNYSIKGSKK
jgi:DivIVA domain-containing protein